MKYDLGIYKALQAHLVPHVFLILWCKMNVLSPRLGSVYNSDAERRAWFIVTRLIDRGVLSIWILHMASPRQKWVDERSLTYPMPNDVQHERKDGIVASRHFSTCLTAVPQPHTFAARFWATAATVPHVRRDKDGSIIVAAADLPMLAAGKTARGRRASRVLPPAVCRKCVQRP